MKKQFQELTYSGKRRAIKRIQQKIKKTKSSTSSHLRQDHSPNERNEIPGTSSYEDHEHNIYIDESRDVNHDNIRQNTESMENVNDEGIIESNDSEVSISQNLEFMNDNHFVEDESKSEDSDIDDSSSSASSNKRGNEENDNDHDLRYEDLIYNDGPITVSNSMMIMLSLALKYNLPDTCIEDFFTAIRFHCRPEGRQKMNLYYYKKYFSQGKNMQKIFYCEQCHSPAKNDINVCDFCHSSNSKHYFVTLSIVDQIKQIFQKVENYQSIEQRFQQKNNTDNNLYDLWDGQLYKQQKKYFSKSTSLSLTWYTDGVPIFKSSEKSSVWPFYLRINELPYEKRIQRDNTILAGLWFGSHKPSPNLFVNAFKKDLQTLYRGISFPILSLNKLLKLKFILLCGTGDLPAKYSFLNFKQFNSEFGCMMCEIKTEPTKLPSNTSVRVYKYEKNLKIRSLDDTLQYAKEALLLKSTSNIEKNYHAVKGIKGYSVFKDLMPNYVTGIAIDSMHTIYEGVVKKLLFLWFDSSCNDYGFSLNSMKDVISTNLLRIKPPKFIHRMPRSIEKYQSWKASELKCWFFYYSPIILSTIMKPEYFHHYLLLITAVSYLNQDHVSPQDILKAEEYLDKFVEKFEILYGVRFCSINIHLLLHLAYNVNNLGPLWVHSCFSYEDLNGQLVKLVNGNTNMESQIINSHWQYLKFSVIKSQETNDDVRSFIEQHKKQVKICQSFSNFHVVGTYKKNNFEEDEVVDKLIDECNGTTIRHYYRLLKNNLLYISERYNRLLQTDSSFVSYLSSTETKLAKILYFVKVSSCNCIQDKCLCAGNHFAIIKPVTIKKYLSFINVDKEVRVPYIYHVSIENALATIPVEDLSSVCFAVYNNEELFLAKKVNCMESE